MKRICVFCGSSPGVRPAYADAARSLGRIMAEQKIGLVFGGGGVGLMKELADSILAAGGEATGVIPRILFDMGVAHKGLTELKIVPGMHERKARMAALCDAFIALPGGIGTLEELMEALTWSQLGIHRKPCGILNVNGYYDPLIRMVESAVEEGFLKKDHGAMLVKARDPETLLDRLARCSVPRVEKYGDLKIV